MKDDGDAEGGGASSSLSEAAKDLAWETLVHHARQHELCFVTARPTRPDYDSPGNRKLSLGKVADLEKKTTDALVMKPNNPSLRCVFPILHFPIPSSFTPRQRQRPTQCCCCCVFFCFFKFFNI